MARLMITVALAALLVVSLAGAQLPAGSPAPGPASTQMDQLNQMFQQFGQQLQSSLQRMQQANQSPDGQQQNAMQAAQRMWTNLMQRIQQQMAQNQWPQSSSSSSSSPPSLADIRRQLSARFQPGAPPTADNMMNMPTANAASRKKRDVTNQQAYQQQMDPIYGGLQQQQQQQQLGAEPQPSRQDVIAYNQNIQQQSNRLALMMQSLRNNPYLPTREQAIAIITTIVSLLFMMIAGPSSGSSAPLINALVRQVVPIMVAYGVNYAAESPAFRNAAGGAGAGLGPNRPLEAPITNVQLQPVQAQQSAFGTAF